jgi:hypothetical protein
VECFATTMADNAGVPIIISDDSPMFSTTLNREYGVAAELLGFDQAAVRRAGPGKQLWCPGPSWPEAI